MFYRVLLKLLLIFAVEVNDWKWGNNYYYTLNQALEMVAADSDSGIEPDYSELKFSDSDQML